MPEGLSTTGWGATVSDVSLYRSFEVEEIFGSFLYFGLRLSGNWPLEEDGVPGYQVKVSKIGRSLPSGKVAKLWMITILYTY